MRCSWSTARISRCIESVALLLVDEIGFTGEIEERAPSPVAAAASVGRRSGARFGPRRVPVRFGLTLVVGHLGIRGFTRRVLS